MRRCYVWRRPAGIAFSLDRVLVTPALRPPERRQLVRGIVDAKRDNDGKSDPGRIKKLNQLVDKKRRKPSSVC
ncbi:MAG: hypothetical protein K9M02_21930 [Thiohalocapsa sp.]|nr:hypothetical protein [Thiohalocapsa sp.]